MELTIFNRFDFLRYGSYLEALIDTLNPTLKFSSRGFVESYLNIMLVSAGNVRMVIDADDKNEICKTALNWCDIYGKVNIDSRSIPRVDRCKVIALPPSIAVRPRKALPIFFRWLLSAPVRRAKTIMLSESFALAWQFLRTYRDRSTLVQYRPETPLSSFLYYRAVFWTSHPTEGNERRLLFFRAAQGLFDDSRIGFVIRKGVLPKEYDTFETKRYDSHRRFVRETQRSTIVFNSPSTYGANSWRLAEYLALGKAIISTPINNNYYIPLEHGVNIHFVEPNENSIRSAIVYLLEHPEYRKELETNARKYWLEYCTPHKSIRTFLALTSLGDRIPEQNSTRI